MEQEKDNFKINLNINSIFEMLPPASESRLAIIGERNSDLTWTDGKRVIISEMSNDQFYSLGIADLMSAVYDWEARENRRFNALTLSEKDSVDILNIAISCKKKK